MQLSQVLERRGVTTAIVEIPEEGVQQKHVDQILSLRPELTCSFSPMIPVADKVLLCDFLKIPHLAVLVEPAIYNLYLAKSPYIIVSCVDYFDCELFFNAHCERVFYMGYAVTAEQLLEPPLDKTYDIVFIGRIVDPEAIRDSWRANYSEDIRQVLEKAVELTLADDHTAFAQALVYAWRVSGIDPVGNDFPQLCREVESYSRAFSTLELLKAVEGQVDVFGVDTGGSVGYEEKSSILQGHPNIVLHPQLSAEDVWHVLKQSKICLSATHCFKHGAQAEVIYALAAGALVLAGANKYLEIHFGEERGVVPYLNGEWSHVNERLNHYLNHESERQGAVERGQKNLALEHTWDVRADDLLKRSSDFWDSIAERNFVRTFE